MAASTDVCVFHASDNGPWKRQSSDFELAQERALTEELYHNHPSQMTEEDQEEFEVFRCALGMAHLRLPHEGACRTDRSSHDEAVPHSQGSPSQNRDVQFGRNETPAVVESFACDNPHTHDAEVDCRDGHAAGLRPVDDLALEGVGLEECRKSEHPSS